MRTTRTGLARDRYADDRNDMNFWQAMDPRKIVPSRGARRNRRPEANRHLHRNVGVFVGRAVTLPIVMALLLALAVAAPPDAGAAEGVDFVQVSAGYNHTCAATDAGEAYCWGSNSYGQLGDGTTTDRDTPTRVSGLSGVTDISAGYQHTCAATDAGEAYCWGSNIAGKLGDGTSASRHTPTPVAVVGVTDISAAYRHTCATTATGVAFCWGNDNYGQLGGEEIWLDFPVVRDALERIPTLVLGLLGVTDISTGRFHTCAATAASVAFCWGRNSDGQIGDGTTTRRHIPTFVSGLVGATGISAGGSHTCAATAVGEAHCWGSNTFGELGDGTTTERHSPTFVSGLSGVADISAGRSHTCAGTDAGGAYCWGNNNDGQVGDGTTAGRHTPTRVSGLSDVAGISAGYRHTCAVTDVGEAYCWGSNSSGRLGDGTTTDRHTPTRVSDPEPDDPTDDLPDPSQVIDDVLGIVGGVIDDLPGPPSGSLHPSSACTGGVVVADGFAGDTYVKLRGDQPDSETTRLCFRADNDQSGFGGRVDITDPQGAGVVDTTTGFACTSTPVLDGELGDPSEPATHVPYTVAVDDASGETVLCVRVDDFERSITTSTSPEAVFDVLLDEPSTYAVRPDWPAVPSAACADQGGDRHVDAESFGTRVRLASYSSGTGQAQLCVRADGPVPVGGVLTVDTSGAPGVEPVIETGSDRTACTLNVLSTSQPATVEVTRSPTGDIPASVCVRVEGTVLRVTVGVEGDPTLPSVTWTPDPNTPG